MGAVLLAITALFAVGVIASRLANREDAPPAPVAPAAPAAGGEAAHAAEAWHQKPLYWAIGAVVALIVLAVVWSKVSAGVMTVIMIGAVAVFLIAKAGTTGKWLGVPLLFLVVFFGPNFIKFTEKFYEWSNGFLDGKPFWTSSASTSTEKMATWAGWSPGKPMPVGVWSETISIPVGSGSRWAKGCEMKPQLFKVRYQFYSKEWVEHPCDGSKPPASHLQVMILEPGKDMTIFPVAIVNQ